MLESGFHDVPKGRVAAVVTHLEMAAPAPPRAVPDPEGLTLTRLHAPDPERYLSLYRKVGAADWLWFSRLVMPAAKLAQILSNPAVKVYALQRDGSEDVGLLELDFRTPGICELAFFGLAPGLVGQGAGRWLMNRAIEIAWAHPITRLDVHTCTLDHPDALGFYRRSGFTPVRQQVEIAEDPRLMGALPRAAGSRVPIFDPD
ncbi:GNAT family N-acetyltransferase [Oceaniglobus indicus]|uniref:GNAT family N-acetyltransferase n=1 Tax=Oceaniglobus indicus TaxID=2047749 RepID=UPI000C18687F|nr:GNAT family N-acetyltransferase [Oceaniglobus indicus]